MIPVLQVSGPLGLILDGFAGAVIERCRCAGLRGIIIRCKLDIAVNDQRVLHASFELLEEGLDEDPGQ